MSSRFFWSVVLIRILSVDAWAVTACTGSRTSLGLANLLYMYIDMYIEFMHAQKKLKREEREHDSIGTWLYYGNTSSIVF